MIETINEPVALFLVIMAVILVTPLLSKQVHLPGIVGIILGGMLVGPHGLHWLAAGSQVEFLATIGLVYLMFSAGLEVDIHQFTRVGGKAMFFGMLTFLFPQIMGMGLGRLMGMSWLGSVLLGSAFSSHTLIAFPILTRLGVIRNEAVSVTIGATVMTDISAFVVLAVVLGIQAGSLQASFFIKLFILLILYAVVILIGLPRLGKLFFRRFSGRAVEFQFVLVAVFIAALLAKKIGVHEVVGAFLAGLAINATLPRQSPVIGHLIFMGESFFIPIFLMYSGMMTNPRVFVESWQTIVVAAGVTLVAYLSKLIAAWITAKTFRYSQGEFLTAYGLSHAQAAVTIPTLVIGLEIGLFSSTLFNAAIIMILLTSITSPILVQHYGSRLKPSPVHEELGSLFKCILVPIVNPQTQEHLLTLASVLTHSEQGTLIATHVARESRGRVIDLDHQQELLGRIPLILKDPDAKLKLLPRIDSSPAKGILHTALETNATLILMGWRGKPTIQQNLLGTVIDEVIWGTNIPVLVGKLTVPINAAQQITLILPPDSLSPGAIQRALEIVVTMTNAINLRLQILSDPFYNPRVKLLLSQMRFDREYSLLALKGNILRTILANTGELDMIVIPSTGSRRRFRSSLGSLPEEIATFSPGNIMVLHYAK